MQISAELFSEIVAKLNSDPKPMKGNERRRAPRVGIRSRVDVERFAPGGRVERSTVLVRELSRTGIGFMHPAAIEKTETVKAYFPRNDGGFVVVEYEVRHCEQLSTKQHLIGGRLRNTTEMAAPRLPPPTRRRAG